MEWTDQALVLRMGGPFASRTSGSGCCAVNMAC